MTTYTYIYSEVDRDKRAKRGVSIAIRKNLKKNIKSWEPVNEYKIRVDMRIKGYDCVILGIFIFTHVKLKQRRERQFLRDVNGLTRTTTTEKRMYLNGRFQCKNRI